MDNFITPGDAALSFEHDSPYSSVTSTESATFPFLPPTTAAAATTSEDEMRELMDADTKLECQGGRVREVVLSLRDIYTIQLVFFVHEIKTLDRILV
ncbi:hypothetical protein VKT23_019816 [Stygiomarasmius scandens]|uniref:Uncharacterized protein n=1 Tax=Marasmiellus scandens TaxID=2682957 RepID=A0ABR1INL7_9AGAR